MPQVMLYDRSSQTMRSPVENLSAQLRHLTMKHNRSRTFLLNSHSFVSKTEEAANFATLKITSGDSRYNDVCAAAAVAANLTECKV